MTTQFADALHVCYFLQHLYLAAHQIVKQKCLLPFKQTVDGHYLHVFRYSAAVNFNQQYGHIGSLIKMLFSGEINPF